MLGLWSFVRFLHVLSAMVWVGGQLTISAMLLPVVRTRLPISDRGAVMRAVGRRFGIFTVAVFLPVQIGTGALLAAHVGVTFGSLTHPGYGRTLLAKLIVFALVMVVSGFHGLAQSRGAAQIARALAMGSLFGSIVIILLATALATT